MPVVVALQPVLVVEARDHSSDAFAQRVVVGPTVVAD
jgi:hypothetical protein